MAKIWSEVYEEAKEFFLRGKHEQALEDFKTIYEQDVGFRDVADIINDMLIPLTPVVFGASLADGQAEISDHFERVSRAIFRGSGLL